MEDLPRILMAFISTPSLLEARRIVTLHPGLLSREADTVQILALLSRLSQDDEADIATSRRVQARLALLTRCREVGVDHAFAEEQASDRERTNNVKNIVNMPAKSAPPAASTSANQPDGRKDAGGRIMAFYAAEFAEIYRLRGQSVQDPRLLPLIISRYERLLNQIAPDHYLELRASIQINLGNSYCDLPTGDRARNLEHGINCFLKALSFFTPETSPLDYALIQNSLGTAYASLPTGSRGKNLNRAIQCYLEASRFYTAETDPLNFAMVQTNLGNAYCDMPVGDSLENLQLAIKYFLAASVCYLAQNAQLEYADVQHNLGTAYIALPTMDRLENLERAINCFQQALRFYKPAFTPLKYAMAQISLGNVYCLRLKGDHGVNLKLAVKCFQEALRFYKPTDNIIGYAYTQINLGNAYRELPSGSRLENLQLAIGCFEATLRVLRPEAEPLAYAMAQVNLGTAYFSLPTADPDDYLHRAINCYLEALRYYTVEEAPIEYANTQHNLGNAYAALRTGDRATNVKLAMSSFQKALSIHTASARPLDYARTQNAFGIALTGMPTEENIRQAIICFQEVLRFFGPETEPAQYVEALNNLGAAYLDSPIGDRKENLKYAIDALRRALEFLSPEIAPLKYRIGSTNLARAYLELDDWEAALVTSNSGIAAGEILYQAGLSSEGKAAETRYNTLLHRIAAFATARLGDAAQALLTLERGKTRLLAEALHLRVMRPSGVPDHVWDAYEQATAAIRAPHLGVFGQDSPQHDPVAAYKVREQQARDASIAVDRAVAQVRVHAPDFLKPLDLPTLAGLLSDKRSALLAFCVTNRGSIGLMLTREQPDSVFQIDLDDFTLDDLRRLLGRVDDRETLSGGWLGAYLRYSRESIQQPDGTDLSCWLNAMDQVLAELGRRLLAPILAAIPSEVERLILLPSDDLFVFPLHAILLSQDGAERLCDRYTISYGPSAEVLAISQLAAALASGSGSYCVTNPTRDHNLPFSPLDGRILAQLSVENKQDEGSACTLARVIEHMQGKAYVHFSCHGSYNWADPPSSKLLLADEPLTLAKLQSDAIDMSGTRLLVLAACESGISDVLGGNGDEYVGFPAGFLMAGVPCVVSSLWSVPDISTALLMECFYRNHLLHGLDVAAALREAQLWLRNLPPGEIADYAARAREQIRPGSSVTALWSTERHYRYRQEQNPEERPFAHPYYWAAFVVNGL